MANINKRLEDLKRKLGGATVYGVQWSPDSETINVKGKEIPRAEYERLYPDAVTIEIEWVEDYDQELAAEA